MKLSVYVVTFLGAIGGKMIAVFFTTMITRQDASSHQMEKSIF